MSTIKQLYFNYINDPEAYNMPVKIDEVETVNKELKNFIKSGMLDKETMFKIDDLATAAAAAYEWQGFMMGFSLATRILSETGIRKEVANA